MLSKLIAAVLHRYLRLVFRTSRWEMRGNEQITRNARTGTAQIFVFWHGRLAMMPAFKPHGQQTFAVASRHRDGEFLSELMDCFGLRMIRGSSRRSGSSKDRGGRGALVGAIEKLRAGNALAITPDGPRGPRMRLGGHTINIARMTGAALFPMSFSTSNGILLKSWDRFFLPLPFSRGYFFVGEPVSVPKDADAETVEKIRQKVEDALNALTHEADHAANRNETPEPA